MIYQVINIVAPLFIIVSVGYVYALRAKPAMGITNKLIMDIFMPALILSVMVRDDFHASQYLYLMLGGALVILGSGIVAYFVSRVVNIPWRAFVPPAMFSNWANLGIPLYVLTLGDQALGAGVMLVVVGNILCFTIGVQIYSGTLSFADLVKTPILIAVVAGGLVNILDVPLADSLVKSIQMLGQVVIPLMLFSLGVRLTRVSWSDSRAGIIMGIFCPVVGVPLAWLLSMWLPLSEFHQTILILFGVLPPAVINFMLAEQYGNEPEKVASMVLIGNFMAIISIPLLLAVLLSTS